MQFTLIRSGLVFHGLIYFDNAKKLTVKKLKTKFQMQSGVSRARNSLDESEISQSFCQLDWGNAIHLTVEIILRNSPQVTSFNSYIGSEMISNYKYIDVHINPLPTNASAGDKRLNLAKCIDTALVNYGSKVVNCC